MLQSFNITFGSYRSSQKNSSHRVFDCIESCSEFSPVFCLHRIHSTFAFYAQGSSMSWTFAQGSLETHVFPCCVRGFTGALVLFAFLFFSNRFFHPYAFIWLLICRLSLLICFNRGVQNTCFLLSKEGVRYLPKYTRVNAVISVIVFLGCAWICCGTTPSFFGVKVL